MTSEEFENALTFVRHVIQIVSDPVAMARLKMLHAETDGTLEWVRKFDPVPGYEKAPERGTCPTCGKPYTFVADQGGIRRHGSGKCSTHTQAAAELIPAFLVIASLGDDGQGEEREWENTHDDR